METTIKNEYSRGDFVYLITDPDQHKRIVTAIVIRSKVTYELMCGTEVSEHEAMEISKKKTVV